MFKQIRTLHGLGELFLYLFEKFGLTKSSENSSPNIFNGLHLASTKLHFYVIIKKNGTCNKKPGYKLNKNIFEVYKSLVGIVKKAF
jgi:hypothetical protein